MHAGMFLLHLRDGGRRVAPLSLAGDEVIWARRGVDDLACFRSGQFLRLVKNSVSKPADKSDVLASELSFQTASGGFRLRRLPGHAAPRRDKRGRSQKMKIESIAA